MDNSIQLADMIAPSASSDKAALPGDEVPVGGPSDQRLREETLERPERTEFLVSDPNARPKVFRSLSHEILFVLTATMKRTQIVADMFGRRAIMLTSLFVFAVFALTTGFSRNAITINVLNGVMGLTSASIIPSAQGILGTVYDRPSKRKNYTFACFSAGNHLGFVFSAIFSGIASYLFNWSASFWLLAIIYLSVAIIAWFTVPYDDSEKMPFNKASMKQFDFVGVILIVCGIGLFTAGISVGPDAPQGWKTHYIMAFVISGPLLIAAFVWWETRFQYP